MPAAGSVSESKSSAWFREPQIIYSMQLLVVLVLGVSLMLSNPIRDHKHDVYNQTLVPSHVYVTRMLDPMKALLRAGDVPTLLLVPDLKKDAVDKEDTFKTQSVQTYIDKRVFQKDDDDKVSKKIYEFYGQTTGRLSPLQMTMLLSGCYGQPNSTLDFMADEAWIEAIAVPGNDKNWLLPVLLETLEKKVVGDNAMAVSSSEMCQCLKDFSAPNILQVEEDSEAKENVRYQYDTCLGQNLQDYTQNGNDDPIQSTEKAELIAVNRDRKRYRDDPFVAEVASYFAGLADANAVVASTDDHLYKALLYLCSSGHFGSCTIDTTTTFLQAEAIFDAEYIWIKNMKAHNKARPPLIGDARSTHSAPPTILAADYKAYMEKYEHAFDMCRHSAAPQYTVVALARVRVFDYLRLGQGLLLLGALVGFMYWRSTSDCEDGKQQLLMFLKVLAFLLELLILLSVCISLAQMTAVQDNTDQHFGQTNDINPYSITQIEDNTMLSWVLALTWVFVIVLILVLTYLTVKSLRGGGNALPFVPAQIAMDVCVIAGLANMGIGITLQRGFGDEKVVVATFMLFATIGLMQHISNIARICQQAMGFINGDGERAVTPSVHNHVAWNRTANAIFVIVLLLGYGNFASVTYNRWTVDMMYTHQHMWIFIFYAAAIFCGYDAYHELYTGVKGQVCARSYEVLLGRKLRVTAWILIVGSVVMHFHQYSWMCLTKEPYVGDNGSAYTVCQPVGYLFGNTRFYDWK